MRDIRMRALVMEDFSRMTVGEAPRPNPAIGEALIAVTATGICGSDIHGFTGENGRRFPGQIMGHEAVGRLAELGPGTTGLTIGDVVTFNPVVGCGECTACRAGTPGHCPDRTVIGVAPERAAAFADYVLVPARNVVALPGLGAVEHGALVEPLAVAFRAVARARVSPGDDVLVTGGGPIGQSVILAALRAGAARVVVTDVDAVRRALCTELGAEPLDPSAGPVGEQLRGLLGREADVAIDAVGLAATIADCLAGTRRGGVVCLVGMGAPRVELGAFAITTEEHELIGSFCYSDAEFIEAATWVCSAPQVLDLLISRTVPLSEGPAAFAALAGHDGTPGKVLVAFGDRSPA